MTKRRRLTAIVVSLLLPGCATDHEPIPPYSVADSAGVRVVTNRLASWDAGDEWHLSAAPRLEFGGASDVAGPLWGVRGVDRLSDGRFVVLNSGSSKIRVYSLDGAQSDVFGGQGGGPGEVAYAMSMTLLPGDTVVVLDRTGDRVFYSADGTFLTEDSFITAGVTSPFGGERFHLDRMLPDGTLLARFSISGYEPAEPSGWFRPEVRFSRRDRRWSEIAEYGTYGEIQQEYIDVGLGQAWPVVPPFSRTTNIAVGGSPVRVAVGDNDTASIPVYTFEGEPSMIVRWEAPPQPVTADEVASWKDAQRKASWTRDQLPQLEVAWEKMRVPETKPAFSNLVLDSEGNLWVANVVSSGEWVSKMMVFDPGGILRGEVAMPSGLVAHKVGLLSIGVDHFAGVFLNDSDEEFVRVYRLTKP